MPIGPIIAVSMAVGSVGGASVTAIARGQPYMQSAPDHLVTADALPRQTTRGGYCDRARSLISPVTREVDNGIRFAN